MVSVERVCPVSCYLTGEPDETPEPCTLNPTERHQLHVGAGGWVWDDDRRILVVPPVTDAQLAAIREIDPDGHGGPFLVASHRQRSPSFKNRWDSYADRPPLERRLSRAGYVAGLALGAVIAACVLAVAAATLVLAFGAIGVWLSQ